MSVALELAWRGRCGASGCLLKWEVQERLFNPLARYVCRKSGIFGGGEECECGAVVQDVSQLGWREGRGERDGDSIAGETREESDCAIPLACETRIWVARAMRTYIVVAVLDEESEPLTCNTRPIHSSPFQQFVLGDGNVVEQGSIGEGASGQRMHYGGAGLVVVHHRLEQGGSLERGHCASGGGEGTRSIVESDRRTQERRSKAQTTPWKKGKEQRRTAEAH